jgi:hypothetical protein
MKSIILLLSSWLICATSSGQTNQLNQAVDLCLEKHKSLGENFESILLFIPDSLAIGTLKSEKVQIVEEMNNQSTLLEMEVQQDEILEISLNSRYGSTSCSCTFKDDQWVLETYSQVLKLMEVIDLK